MGDAIKEHWQQLQSREQWMVVGCTVFVVISLLIFAVIKPMYGQLDLLEKRYQSDVRTLQWLGTAAEQIQQQRRSGNNGQGESLSTLVDASLPQFQLTMQRFQPSGKDKAQLWFENIPYKQLVAWLHYVESEKGVNIDAVSMNNEDASGRVSARVRLQR
ncbi:Type II secretion system protein M [Sinobacterium norvegicum]|uniref:Type II secretion system protein M n=1 Tax=Sinobacterium norvegicum TaxID=1641715 RepID=A0ABM9AH20_9GAMM|nr:type II secretion system protein M [Sinobacterium norvegicum]CAH0992498.1 Type II secretion system protein M [Sinobacterium norvegicum]